MPKTKDRGHSPQNKPRVDELYKMRNDISNLVPITSKFAVGVLISEYRKKCELSATKKACKDYIKLIEDFKIEVFCSGLRLQYLLLKKFKSKLKELGEK